MLLNVLYLFSGCLIFTRVGDGWDVEKDLPKLISKTLLSALFSQGEGKRAGVFLVNNSINKHHI